MSVFEVRAGPVVLRFLQSFFAVVIAILTGGVLADATTSMAQALGIAPGSPELIVFKTIGQFVGFSSAAILFLFYSEDFDMISINNPTLSDGGWVIGGILALLAVQFGVAAGLQTFGIDFAQNQAIAPGQESPVYFLYMIPVSIMFVGPAEELLFRGIVQGEMKKALGAPTAILVASLLFGLSHTAAVDGTSTQILLTLVTISGLGAMLGGIYEYTGNLTVPALAHGAYNAVLFGLQYAAA
jgi:membrane protease YdiL (CAAX protease family)